jgi:hypothetical protein
MTYARPTEPPVNLTAARGPARALPIVRPVHPLLLALLSVAALAACALTAALALPAPAHAETFFAPAGEPAATTAPSSAATEGETAGKGPAETANPTQPGTGGEPAAASTQSTPSATTTTPGTPSTTTTAAPAPATSTAPEVQTQARQTPSEQPSSHTLATQPSAPARKTGAAKHAHHTAAKHGPPASKLPTKTAPLPSALTPAFPGSLGAPIGAVPDFYIESFSVPPFLLPIYQAAGAAYGIPWQVLAAINEVETDYGRDLSVSSAGAEGWMQFLPSSWARYGVDVNGDGYEDPYNPADAVFAAARYLAAAGGATHIRAAIFAYNHSPAYVEAVMLRAQLLDGTPAELLGAITGLTESRFPVHAPSHFTDGFPTLPGEGGQASRTLPGTTIYAPAGSPVIAVQDGQVVAVGDTPTLGHYISLRDAYGNTYTYADLGDVAELYPVLEPRQHTPAASAPPSPSLDAGPRPSAPASAGVQPRSPLSAGAVSSNLALGAAASLEGPPAAAAPAPTAPSAPPAPPAPHSSAALPHTFRAGPDEVYLHALRPGVQVLAGTVLGHLGSAAGGPGVVPAAPAAPAGAGAGASAATGAPTTAGTPALGVAQPEAHMLFQIRPAGAGAPLIDPKPILDGWVELENTSLFRAHGTNPFLSGSPSAGQVLLESKPQLQREVLRDPNIAFATRCGRGAVQAGQVDRRVLAALEFLSVSGLRPTISSLACAHEATAGSAAANSAGDTFDISAIDGVPIAGHEAPGSLADIAIHRLLRLQGTMRPRTIASGSLSYPGAANTLALPSDRGLIHVDFEAAAPPAPGAAQAARAASVQSSPLSPAQWIALVARLGEIPNPTVAGKPSSAAIPDPGSAAAAGSGLGAPSAGTGGN